MQSRSKQEVGAREVLSSVSIRSDAHMHISCAPVQLLEHRDLRQRELVSHALCWRRMLPVPLHLLKRLFDPLAVSAVLRLVDMFDEIVERVEEAVDRVGREAAAARIHALCSSQLQLLGTRARRVGRADSIQCSTHVCHVEGDCGLRSSTAHA